jgi:hypothetical protein
MFSSNDGLTSKLGLDYIVFYMLQQLTMHKRIFFSNKY